MIREDPSANWRRHALHGIALLAAGAVIDAVERVMSAADLVVTKPGGLTVSECLARHKPMLLVSPIPGQEERNSDHLLEEGVAIRCNNLPVLADKIDRLLGDPPRMNAMRERARRMARPRAAEEIIAKLISL